MCTRSKGNPSNQPLTSHSLHHLVCQLSYFPVIQASALHFSVRTYNLYASSILKIPERTKAIVSF